MVKFNQARKVRREYMTEGVSRQFCIFPTLCAPRLWTENKVHSFPAYTDRCY